MLFRDTALFFPSISIELILSLTRIWNQSDSFIRGFNRWKRAFCANEGFIRHQNSHFHKISEINYRQYIERKTSATTVLQVIDKSRNEFIKLNHQKMIQIVSTLHLYARQTIAIRGHEESDS